MNVVADQQRKRNVPQSRPNVAQQNSAANITGTKKGNKQNQAQPSTQNQKQASPQPPSPAPTPPPKAKSPSLPRSESHDPSKGFNVVEIDAFLSGGVEQSSELYRSEPQAAQKTGPWGQKPGTMATGKDFWLELRKQVGSLHKGESTNKGG